MKITLKYQMHERGRGYREGKFPANCKFVQKDSLVYIYSEDGKTYLGVTPESMEAITRKIRLAENDDMVNRIVLILSERFDEIESKQDEILENQRKILEMLSKNS